MSTLWESAKSNLSFLGVCLLVFLVLTGLAVLSEKFLMLAALAFVMAVARRELYSGSAMPPPSLTATIISLEIFVNAAARLASCAPFVFWMLCHLECPDIGTLPFLNIAR